MPTREPEAALDLQPSETAVPGSFSTMFARTWTVKYALASFLALLFQQSVAATQCKDIESTWLERYPAVIEAFTGKRPDTLGPATRHEIKGKWYDAPKGDKYRRATPLFEFFEDGTGMEIGEEFFDYEIHPDKILIKYRIIGDLLPSCGAIFRVGGTFYIPSHEQIIRPLFR